MLIMVFAILNSANPGETHFSARGCEYHQGLHCLLMLLLGINGLIVLLAVHMYDYFNGSTSKTLLHMNSIS